MKFKIEKTGCSVRTLKDAKQDDCHFTQVRMDFFLDSSDIGYDKQHVLAPIIPLDGYPGKKNETGTPDNMGDYISWIKSLPTVFVDKPFHAHFVQLNSDVKDEEILFVAAIAMSWAYEKWTIICNGNLEGLEVLEIWKTLKNLPLTPIDNNYVKELHDQRISEIVSADFTKVQDASLYQVRV
jgi:hypothetical protein